MTTMSDPAYIVFCQNSTAVFRLEKDDPSDVEEESDDDDDDDDDRGVGLLLFLAMSQIRST